MMDLPFHVLANVLPLIKGAQFDELVESIRTNGQRDPIITLNGAILDGRNRYRACLKAGVTPIVEELPHGIDPIAFVEDRNLKRRDLTGSQRALAIAQFATFKRGDANSQHIEMASDRHDGGFPPSSIYTNAEAAKRARVDPKTIKEAKIVLNEGTDEEKSAVMNAGASVYRLAREIRARRPRPLIPPPKYYRRNVTLKTNGVGYRMTPPDGLNMVEWYDRGLQLERSGSSATKAAKTIGMGIQTYDRIRDIVLLASHKGLTEIDKQAAKTAIDALNNSRRVASAYNHIAHIAQRAWGKRGHRDRTDVKRIRAFEHAIGVITQSCERGADMEIPLLSGELVRVSIRQLDEAIDYLRHLIKRIKSP